MPNENCVWIGDRCHHRRCVFVGWLWDLRCRRGDGAGGIEPRVVRAQRSTSAQGFKLQSPGSRVRSRGYGQGARGPFPMVHQQRRECMVEMLWCWLFPNAGPKLFRFLATMCGRHGTRPNDVADRICSTYGNCLGTKCQHLIVTHSTGKNASMAMPPKWDSRGLPHWFWAHRTSCGAHR